MLRYLVTDTPGQVTSTTPKQVLSDDTRVPLRVEVRDKEYKPVDQRQGAGAVYRVPTAPPPPWNWRRSRSKRASTRANGPPKSRAPTWPRSSPAASRRSWARHADLPPRGRRGRELPHVAEPRTAGEAVGTDRRAVLYADRASKLASEISYSEAGITARETRDLWDMPIIFLLALSMRAGSGCCAASGAWYETLRAAAGRRPGAPRGHLLCDDLRPGRRGRLRPALQDVGARYRFEPEESRRRQCGHADCADAREIRARLQNSPERRSRRCAGGDADRARHRSTAWITSSTSPAPI